jgi:PAS domain S-box-containing protein
MADGCPALMWVTDAEGETQFVNRAHQEFCGTSFEDMKGNRWQVLTHPDDAQHYVGALRSAVREHTAFRAEIRSRRADGEWRWVDSYAEPRFSPSGSFMGHVGFSPDTTERKQAEQEMRRAREAAKAANRAKSQFLPI